MSMLAIQTVLYRNQSVVLLENQSLRTIIGTDLYKIQNCAIKNCVIKRLKCI